MEYSKWIDNQIPSIILDTFRLQEETTGNVIEFENLIEMNKNQIILNSFYLTETQVQDYIVHSEGITEKSLYSEQELQYLLDNIYHLPYFKNNKFMNSPIVEVW
jgi:hypothetical protein